MCLDPGHQNRGKQQKSITHSHILFFFSPLSALLIALSASISKRKIFEPGFLLHLFFFFMTGFQTQTPRQTCRIIISISRVTAVTAGTAAPGRIRWLRMPGWRNWWPSGRRERCNERPTSAVPVLSPRSGDLDAGERVVERGTDSRTVWGHSSRLSHTRHRLLASDPMRKKDSRAALIRTERFGREERGNTVVREADH